MFSRKIILLCLALFVSGATAQADLMVPIDQAGAVARQALLAGDTTLALQIAEAVLRQRPAGGILVEELRPLQISSTEIRQMLAAGHSPRYLLPEPVLGYIHRHNLYH